MEMKDKYYHLAKKMNYRARSAFKLLEINKKYHLIQKNSSVLDLGCWPGSWLQVSKQLSKTGVIVGIDLVKIQPIQGIKFYQGDIRKIKERINQKFDVVLSDMAPKTSGNKSLDVGRSIELAEISLEIALEKLKPNGNYLVKIFQGEGSDDFYYQVKKHFSFAKRFKPKSSRTRSKEIYIIAKGFMKKI